MSKIIGATRLSHGTDASTSIERQSDAITRYAEMGRHTLVKITSDVDVSGAVNPFERADLGPWLNGKSGEWDTIVVTKLDRLSRSLIHLHEFVLWCERNGKTLVSLSESVDMSTAAGKMFTQLLGVFAEFERARMSERRTEAAVKIRSNGHWGGGNACPFGYRAVKVNSHYELEIDPMAAAIITELALLIIGGMSMRAACKRLNANGYPTQKGAEWDAASVGAMLRNQALRGYTMHDEQPVRGDDGLPITRDAILDDAQWDKLQAALARLSRDTSARRSDSSLLLRVLYHGDQPLYIHHRPGRGDRYRTGPRAGKSASFSADVVEGMVTGALLSELGSLPMRRLKVIAGEDHTADLAKVSASIADLETLVTSGEMPPKSAARMLATLESRQAELAALPSRPDTPVYVKTGQTFREFWETLGETERHTLLLDNGVTASVTRGQISEPAPRYTAEVFDAKAGYTVWVTFPKLATLLGR